jgi:Fe2+ or Zn2+ uptake regulation protein
MSSVLSSLNIPAYLLEKGIKPSVTRVKIFEYLVAHTLHPTVEEIYKELLEELPTLSKTTVYNTLKLFSEVGVVRTIMIDDNEARFEAAVDSHGHFKCDRCGRIYDLDVIVQLKQPKELEGCIVREQNIYYKGLCKDCSNRDK